MTKGNANRNANFLQSYNGALLCYLPKFVPLSLVERARTESFVSQEISERNRDVFE